MSAQAALARQGIKMADYLLVIDVQADYVGPGKAYPDPSRRSKNHSLFQRQFFYVTNTQ